MDSLGDPRCIMIPSRCGVQILVHLGLSVSAVGGRHAPGEGSMSRADDDEVLHLADPDDLADGWDEDEDVDSDATEEAAEQSTTHGGRMALAGVVIGALAVAVAVAVQQPSNQAAAEFVQVPVVGASPVVDPPSVVPSASALSPVTRSAVRSAGPSASPDAGRPTVSPATAKVTQSASAKPQSRSMSAKPTARATSAANRQTVVRRIDPAWVSSMAVATRIPERALTAYANAQLIVRNMQPSCGIAWNTLAAIGFVESDHGREGGAQLLPDGATDRPILGVPLNGNGVGSVSDTDQGRLDGDSTWDRAVGPMQFIPSSWMAYGVDANGDGVADPNNIDDAAVAAGRLLCSVNSMTTPDGWRQAVFSYNHSIDYANAVATKGNEYAQLSLRAR